MATYYKWRKSEIEFQENSIVTAKNNGTITLWTTTLYYSGSGKPALENGKYHLTGKFVPEDTEWNNFAVVVGEAEYSDAVYVPLGTKFIQYKKTASSIQIRNGANAQGLKEWSSVAAPGPLVGNVYSTSPSAYPNGGASGSYYYDQRTTVTSPTAPSGLSYPEQILTRKAAVSWTAATSSTDYPVQSYEVSRSTDGGGSWTVVNAAVTGTSLTAEIPVGVTAIRFRVRAKDSNGQWGSYVTGTDAAVLLSPTLTVPELAMQGQSVAVSWSELEGADSYTLQRKADTDADWVQMYTGAGLTFTETAGAWTSVQYRVQAVFGGVPGGWAQSAAIPVVSAAALVISGQDGDLGTLVSDVPYSVSTDTGKQIRLTLLVNGAEVYTRMIDSGYANRVLILDLTAGTGTITLKAEVQASSGTVSAVRSWTYTKEAIPFETGRVDVMRLLDAEGTAQYPATVAEAVRLPGGKTLDQVTQYPAQVVTGSYVGTGTYGADNPNTLRFVFAPKLALVTAEGATGLGDTTGMAWNGNPTVGTKTVTVDGNSLSWHGNSAANQLNTSGTRYYYTVIG